jgi:hypothetical protein
MEGIETSFSCQHIIDPVILNQVFNDVHVSVIRRVEQGSEAFWILHVHPDSDFLILIPLIKFLLTACHSEEVLLGLIDEEPDDIEVALEGELM